MVDISEESLDDFKCQPEPKKMTQAARRKRQAALRRNANKRKGPPESDSDPMDDWDANADDIEAMLANHNQRGVSLDNISSNAAEEDRKRDRTRERQ